MKKKILSMLIAISMTISLMAGLFTVNAAPTAGSVNAAILALTPTQEVKVEFESVKDGDMIGDTIVIETGKDGGSESILANTDIDGTVVIYRNVNLNKGVTKINLRYAMKPNANTENNGVTFHVDSSDGPVIGTVLTPQTGNWDTYVTATGVAENLISGTHDIYAVLNQKGGATAQYVGNLNWFSFEVSTDDANLRTITANDVTAVKAIRTDYEALDESQKAEVTKLDILKEAEVDVAELLIAAVPTVATLALTDRQSVIAAREAYDALDATSQAALDITNLEAAEVKIVELIIDGLPDISLLTLADEANVEDARAEYNALSEAQQALVAEGTLAKLVEAEEKLVIIKIEEVEAVIDEIPDTVTTADLQKILDAKAALEALSEEEYALVSEAGKAKLASAITAYLALAVPTDTNLPASKTIQGDNATVTLTAPADAPLYYTINGTNPSLQEDGTPAEGTIKLEAASTVDVNFTATTTIKAVIETQLGLGAVVESVYTLEAPTTKVDVISVTLPKSMTVNKGKQKDIKVTVNPTNATDSTVKWSTDNAKIAKVVGNKVVGVGAGKTTIKATVGGKTASCVVTVKAPVTKIKLAKKLSVNKGKSLKLKTKITIVTPKKAYALTPKYTFKMAKKFNKSARLNKKGVVKGLKKGKTVKVQIFVNGKRRATAKIKIK